ncbi:MAG: hypothetical protein M1584_01180, partial [Deltaproteobacteria bacterium]|nr:hypothetical protein [Deltaproteobacteria bacterium]
MRSIHKFKEICFSILAFLILTFFILTVPSYASKSKSNKKKYTGSFLNIRFTTSKLNKNKISGKNGAAQVVIVSSANTNNSSQDNKVFIKKIKPKKHETAKKTAVVA